MPHPVHCEAGSSYPRNELFWNVQRGVDYTYQIGTRDSAPGNVKMLFNYAYRSKLMVAPFLTAGKFASVPGQPGEFKILKLRVIGLTPRENASVACALCLQGTFRHDRRSNFEVFRPVTPTVINSGSRIIIGGTSPAQIGRFAVHALDPAHRTFPVVARGCLAPGVTTVPAEGALRLSLLDRVLCPTQFLNPIGAEYVFWHNKQGGLYERWYAGGAWSGTIKVNSRTFGSPPAVAVHANGEQDVFWRGTDGNLWETWYTGTWAGPSDLKSGPLGSAPSVGVDAAGNEYAFWEGVHGGLWERSYSGGSWSAPHELGAKLLGSAPAVAVHANGEQDVFWKGAGGHLWEIYYAGHWSSPRPLGGGQLGSAPAIGVDAAGNEYVFWEGLDHGLWEMFYSGGTWSRASELTSGKLTADKLDSPPAVAVHANGEQDVFWKGSDGHLWEIYYTRQWIGPVQRGRAQLGSAPAVGVDAVGKQSHG